MNMFIFVKEPGLVCYKIHDRLFVCVYLSTPVVLLMFLEREKTTSSPNN
jgi:hypothetical protein